MRQHVDEILSGEAAPAQDWALHMLARRDISQATMDEIVEAQTTILYGMINAVRELAKPVRR